MADLPQVGLEAVLENLDGFLKGARSIEDAFESVMKAEAKVAKKSPEAAATLEQMRQAFVDSGGDIRDWADTLEEALDQGHDSLESIYALLSAGAIQQVAGRLGAVGDQILGLAKDSVMTAARLEELSFVLANLAEQNNISEQALRDQVQAVRDQGIQADVAYNLVSQFVRGNLDLAKASSLARVAQDAAVISMEDSSQALAGLLHGIMTLQPEVLRYRGIIVDLQGEYKRWADENNRTVQSMTSVEKQQIALDAVLDQGTSIAGTYTSAMESASKQLRSMPRYVADLKAELGESLLPVYSDAIFATKDLLKWMNELPPTAKSVVAATGTVTGGLFKATSTMVGTGAQIAQLVIGLQALKGTAAASALAFLGPAGLVAGLLAVAGVGVISYIKAQEQAHRDEAAAILESSDNYKQYIQDLEEAGLEAYAFSEALWEVVKAKQEADAAFATQEMQDALKELRGLGVVGLFSIGQWDEGISKFLEDASDMALVIAKDRDQMLALGKQLGFSGDRLEQFADIVTAAASRQEDLRQLTELADNSLDAFTERMNEAAEASMRVTAEDQAWMELFDAIQHNEEAMAAVSEEFADFGDLLSGYVTPEVRRLRDELVKIATDDAQGVGAAIATTEQAMVDAVKDYETDITKIQDNAAADREQAQADHLEKETDLWDDHSDQVADILLDLAKVDEDLMADRAEAEAQYQDDRVATVAESAQEMADLMAEQSAELAELEQDLANDLADINREYRQDRQDAARDLARDLEDVDRDLVDKLGQVWQDYYAELESLAEQHGQRMAAIEERYANERAKIEDKYRTEATPEEMRDQEREALMGQLEELRRLQSEGMTGIDYTQMINDVLGSLDELKQQEIDALDEARAAEVAAEEAAWQEEQARAAERRDIELQAERDAAEAQRQERQLAYDRQLEDLSIAHKRQIDERKRAYGEQLATMIAQHEKERAEQERRAAEALAKLDQRHAEELAKLDVQAEEVRARLQERLADEESSYAERQSKLSEALDKQLGTIDTKMQDQADKAKEKADTTTKNYIDAWNLIDPAVSAALQKTKDQVIVPMMDGIVTTSYDKGKAAGQAYAQGFLDGSGIHSMPQWAIDAGKEIQQGLVAGFDVRGFSTQIQAMVPSTFQTAIPANMAQAGMTQISNQRTYQLNYTGQPQGETSIRNLITLMEMASP